MSLYLFTYGTLQVGERNHHVIERWVERADPASASGWLLWHVAQGSYPGILPGAGLLHGTLFTFDDAHAQEVLAACDTLESYHPDDLQRSKYIRQEATITLLPHGTTQRAHLYGWNPRHAGFLVRHGTPIEDGDWRRYIQHAL